MFAMFLLRMRNDFCLYTSFFTVLFRSIFYARVTCKVYLVYFLNLIFPAIVYVCKAIFEYFTPIFKG